jgi:hypothetical protein
MRKLKGPNDYEVIRGIIIDILLGKETIKYGVGNFNYLSAGVGQVMERRKFPSDEVPMAGSSEVRMDDRDAELVRDIFWDLFRQGLITIGSNTMNDGWPNFRLSHHAAQTLAKASPYRFHNSASYIKLVKAEAPEILADTEQYLNEAVITYYAECLLASCVMLGVAAEIEFCRMITAGASSAHAAFFDKAEKERQMLPKIVAFQRSYQNLPKTVRDVVGEDFDINMNATQAILRVARNNSGHGHVSRIPPREQMYINLQMFIPFVGCVERLRKAL